MNIRKLSRLDELLEKQNAEEKLFGASLMIEHKGKKVYDTTIGTDRKDSIYKLFSMTKPITAVAAMILYEDGDLDLFSKVSDYLPAFKDMQVVTPNGLKKAENEITIRDLLNMTSGISYDGDFGEAQRSMSRVYREAKIQVGSGILSSNTDVCNKLAEAYLEFEPGTSYGYGFSADIMAGIIEIITGTKFSEFLLKEIFTPLNMTDTAFYIDENKSLRQAVLYRRSRDINDKTLVRAEEDIKQRLDMDKPFSLPWYESGGKGLYSTMEDYTHFAEMLINKGSYHGKELIGHKTLEFMTSNQLSSPQLQAFSHMPNCLGYGYGNYFRVMINPGAAGSNGSIGEFGWDGSCGTYFFVDPTEELIVIYMQQVDGGYDADLIRKIRQIVYGAC